MTIMIEKNISLPNGSDGTRGKYPWSQMQIGDSFLVPGKTSSTMSGCAFYQGTKRSARYACRNVDGGCRVWRVA